MARIDPLAGSSGVGGGTPLDDIDAPPLPREHPHWVRDAVAVSHRARALIARAAPLVLRVLTFWDHPVRSAGIRGRTLSVDFSGSYRLQ